MLTKSFSFLALGATVSYLVSTFLAISLVTGDLISSKTVLVTAYIVYSFSTIAAIHFAGFGFPVWFEFSYTKRFPKYLDFAYLVLVGFGILDVLNFAPNYYTYLLSQGADANSLLREISITAAEEVHDNCGKPEQHFSRARINIYTYYSPEFCQKLVRLTQNKGDRNFILRIAQDASFMDYVTGHEITMPPHFQDAENEVPVVNDLHSPVMNQITRVVILNEFSTYARNEGLEIILKWAAMLLLPVGIGLSVLKTSLELFGDLT